MKNYTEAERRQIVQTLNECKGNYEIAARKLGINPSVVRWADVVVNKKFNATQDGRGRPELRAYIVAIRDIDATPTWDNSDPKIAKARQDYDDGKIEMVTGRDGMNLILYAIPRREVEVRKPYFKPTLQLVS